MKEEREMLLRRVAELSEKLAARSRQCKGLYPMCNGGEFLDAARHRMQAEGKVNGTPMLEWTVEQLNEMQSWLEWMWQEPEQSWQMNALKRVREGEGLGKMEGKKAQETGLEERQARK